MVISLQIKTTPVAAFSPSSLTQRFRLKISLRIENHRVYWFSVIFLFEHSRVWELTYLALPRSFFFFSSHPMSSRTPQVINNCWWPRFLRLTRTGSRLINGRNHVCRKWFLTSITSSSSEGKRKKYENSNTLDRRTDTIWRLIFTRRWPKNIDWISLNIFQDAESRFLNISSSPFA